MAHCICRSRSTHLGALNFARFIERAACCSNVSRFASCRLQHAGHRHRPLVSSRPASTWSTLRASVFDAAPYRPTTVKPVLGGRLSSSPYDPLEASPAWETLKKAKVAEEAYGMSDAEVEAAKAAILEKAMQGRQPADLQLRCTILDSDGNIKTISGKFKKSDLCVEHRLNPRDLRKIDSRVPNLVPTILVRKDAILVNILHIRALVKADTVLLFDTYGSVDTRLNSVFLYDLEHNLKMRGSGALPYEFRALESILHSVLSALESEMVLTRHLTSGLLSELEDDIDRDKLKRLLHYSRRLAAFQNRARLVGVALDEVLEQDEDLTAMYLSDKKAGKPRQLNDHEDLEILLETFSKQVEEIENEASATVNNVQSTQEIVELILDSNRNSLLALDIKVAIMTLGAGVGGLGAGLFGMNLPNHLEGSGHAFLLVSGSAVVVACIISWFGLHKLAKLRRIGLASSRPQKRKVFERSFLLPLPLRGLGHGHRRDFR